MASAIALASIVVGCAQPDPTCKDGIPAPGAVCAVAGSGQQAFNGDGHGPHETDLFLPTAVRVSPTGRLYIADSSNQRIRALNDDGLVETVAGNGIHDPALPGMQAVDSPLENPVDFDFDSEGRLVIVSLHDPRIMRMNEDGTLQNVAGIGEYGDFGDGGSALNAGFLEPTGIVIADDGTIYIADGLASRVRAIEPDGTIVAVAGNGEYGYAGDQGPAIEASLDYPTALALDTEGRLLIADSVNHVVRRVEHDKTITTVGGTGEKGFSGDGGPATTATLNSPEGLAVDADGAIYVSDTRNHRIRRIDADGTMETIAGTGESTWQGDGGPALDAGFYTPTRLSLHDDFLYVADLNNERVRVIALR